MQLHDNTVLITGGTSGIGKALALALRDRGNQVIVAGRRQALLDEITREEKIDAFQVDVADPQALRIFAREIQERFPRLNVLINNAGVSGIEDLTADPVNYDHAETIVQTNVLSVLNLTGLLLPHLRRQPNAAIITTTSGMAYVPRANYPTYCASKAFLHSWIQSLRVQLSREGVEVLELSPPYVQTELNGVAQSHDPNAMPLDEYITEVMEILSDHEVPQGEILVDRVKRFRWAERDGTYDALFKALNPAISSWPTYF